MSVCKQMASVSSLMFQYYVAALSMCFSSDLMSLINKLTKLVL